MSSPVSAMALDYCGKISIAILSSWVKPSGVATTSKDLKNYIRLKEIEATEKKNNLAFLFHIYLWISSKVLHSFFLDQKLHTFVQ